MINLIQTEFSKLKRQKTIFIITGVLLLFWTGMTFWNYHVPQKNFEDFYMKYGSYIAMLLPFLLGLLFIKIYHAEYQNDTLKELLQIPIPMSRLFYAKILFLFLAAVIIMLLNCLLIIISAVICKVTDISAYQTLMLIRFFLTIALSMPFAMFPVFLITALASGNTIFKYSLLYLFAGRNNRSFTPGRDTSHIQYVKYFVWQSTFVDNIRWGKANVYRRYNAFCLHNCFLCGSFL